MRDSATPRKVASSVLAAARAAKVANFWSSLSPEMLADEPAAPKSLTVNDQVTSPSTVLPTPSCTPPRAICTALPIKASSYGTAWSE